MDSIRLQIKQIIHWIWENNKSPLFSGIRLDCIYQTTVLKYFQKITFNDFWSSSTLKRTYID